MSEFCGKLIVFAGRSSFNSLMAQVIGISLVKSGNAFTRLTFISSSEWQTLIALVDAMNALPLSIKRGFENTTSEVAMEESNVGFKEQTNLPIPSLKGYVDGNYCDYRNLNKLNGQEFEVVLHLKDGMQLGTQEVGSTAVEGLKATVHFYFGLPLAENRMQSYPIWINFESYEEFLNLYVVKPTYTLRKLLSYIPVGMNVETTVALSGTAATIFVTTRGDGAPVTGLDADDMNILASNADDVGITAVVESGGGFYIIDIEKDIGDTPADLDTGEYATLQVNQDDATNYTHASNSETFTQP